MDTIRNTVDTENLPSYKRLLTEEYWKISDNEFEAVIEDIIEDVKRRKNKINRYGKKYLHILVIFLEKG